MPTSYSTLQYKVMDRVKSFFGVRPPNYDEEDDFSPLQFTEGEQLRLFGRNWSTSKLRKVMASGPSKRDRDFARGILAERGLLKLRDTQPDWKVACDIHRPRTAQEIQHEKDMKEVWERQLPEGMSEEQRRSISPKEPKEKLPDPNKTYMWQHLDFSGDLYSQHIRKPCRSTSRKLSDLPAYPAVQTDLRRPVEAAPPKPQAEEDEGDAAGENAAAYAEVAAEMIAAHLAQRAAAAAAAATAAEAGDQEDHNASEDQIMRPSQCEVTAAGEAAAAYEFDSRSSPTPEQLRKSSKSMSITQQLQQLRAASKTSCHSDQLVVQPGVAC